MGGIVGVRLAIKHPDLFKPQVLAHKSERMKESIKKFTIDYC